MKDAKLNSSAIAIEPLVKAAQVNGVGVQRGRTALTALDQDRRVEDEDDQELEADQDREHLDRKIDLTVAQHRDDRHGDECVDPPRQVDAEIVAEESCGGGGEQAIQADLHGVVAEQGDHRRGAARGLPQAAGHKAVEGPGAGVMPRHRGIADREDQQNQAHDHVCERNSGAVAQQHGNRGAAGHCGQRSCRRDHEEGDREHPEAAVSQLLRIASRDVGRGRGLTG